MRILILNWICTFEMLRKLNLKTIIVNILIFCCLKYNGYWVLVSQYFELEIDFWNVTIFKSGCHRNDVNLNQLLTAGVNFIGFCDHWSIGIIMRILILNWICTFEMLRKLNLKTIIVTISNLKLIIVTLEKS
jgi:hypothetical protein